MSLFDLLGQAAPALLQGYQSGRLGATQAEVQLDQADRDRALRTRALDLQETAQTDEKLFRRQQLAFQGLQASVGRLTDPRQRAEMRRTGTESRELSWAQHFADVLKDPNQPLNLSFVADSLKTTPDELVPGSSSGNGGPAPGASLSLPGNFGTGNPPPQLTLPAPVQPPVQRPQLGMTPLAPALGLPAGARPLPPVPTPPGLPQDLVDEAYARNTRIAANSALQDFAPLPDGTRQPLITSLRSPAPSLAPAPTAAPAPAAASAAPTQGPPAPAAPLTAAAIDRVVENDPDVVAARAIRDQVSDPKFGYPIEDVSRANAQLSAARGGALQSFVATTKLPGELAQQAALLQATTAGAGLTAAQAAEVAANAQSLRTYREGLIAAAKKRADAALQRAEAYKAAQTKVDSLKGLKGEKLKREISLLDQKFNRLQESWSDTEKRAFQADLAIARQTITEKNTLTGDLIARSSPAAINAMGRISKFLAAKGVQDAAQYQAALQQPIATGFGNYGGFTLPQPGPTININTGPAGATSYTDVPGATYAPPGGLLPPPPTGAGPAGTGDAPPRFRSKKEARAYYRALNPTAPWPKINDFVNTRFRGLK